MCRHHTEIAGKVFHIGWLYRTQIIFASKTDSWDIIGVGAAESYAALSSQRCFGGKEAGTASAETWIRPYSTARHRRWWCWFGHWFRYSYREGYWGVELLLIWLLHCLYSFSPLACSQAVINSVCRPSRNVIFLHFVKRLAVFIQDEIHIQHTTDSNWCVTYSSAISKDNLSLFSMLKYNISYWCAHGFLTFCIYCPRDVVDQVCDHKFVDISTAPVINIWDLLEESSSCINVFMYSYSTSSMALKCYDVLMWCVFWCLIVSLWHQKWKRSGKKWRQHLMFQQDCFPLGKVVFMNCGTGRDVVDSVQCCFSSWKILMLINI